MISYPGEERQAFGQRLAGDSRYTSSGRLEEVLRTSSPAKLSDRCLIRNFPSLVYGLSLKQEGEVLTLLTLLFMQYFKAAKSNRFL